MDSNINLFPNPPQHYKSFVREDSFAPPDLNALNKVSSFMSFGVEYKMKEVNTCSNPVESGFLRQYENLDKKTIPNYALFEVPNLVLANLNIHSLNVNIIDAKENEINFVKKTQIE